VKRLLRKIIDYQRTKRFAHLVGSGTLLQAGFGVEIRAGLKENRVFVGTNSVLHCHIILEREIGEVRIGSNTYIGASQLICGRQIIIGSNVLIAWGCTIVDHDSHSVLWIERQNDVRLWREGLLGGIGAAASIKDWEIVPMSPVYIADNSWIGFNSIILKGVTIGQGAVVGAGSVVTKNVPEWTVVAGNPARIIREISANER